MAIEYPRSFSIDTEKLGPLVIYRITIRSMIEIEKTCPNLETVDPTEFAAVLVSTIAYRPTNDSGMAERISLEDARTLSRSDLDRFAAAVLQHHRWASEVPAQPRSDAEEKPAGDGESSTAPNLAPIERLENEDELSYLKRSYGIHTKFLFEKSSEAVRRGIQQFALPRMWMGSATQKLLEENALLSQRITDSLKPLSAIGELGSALKVSHGFDSNTLMGRAAREMAELQRSMSEKLGETNREESESRFIAPPIPNFKHSVLETNVRLDRVVEQAAEIRSVVVSTTALIQNLNDVAIRTSAASAIHAERTTRFNISALTVAVLGVIVTAVYSYRSYEQDRAGSIALQSVLREVSEQMKDSAAAQSAMQDYMDKRLEMEARGSLSKPTKGKVGTSKREN